MLLSAWDAHPGCLASPRPSEASYPKSLVSLKDGLEIPWGPEERPPSLQVHHFGCWVKRQRLDCFLRPVFPPVLCGKGTVLTEVLGFPNLSINVMLYKGVLGALVLHPPV